MEVRLHLYPVLIRLPELVQEPSLPIITRCLPYHVFTKADVIVGFPTFVLNMVVCPHCGSYIPNTDKCPICKRKLSRKYPLHPLLSAIGYHIYNRATY